METATKKLGLTRTGWFVLLAVGLRGLSHPSEIAAFIAIDRTAASRSLRQLEAAGLIDRQAGKADRRTTEVRLTERGQRVLETGIPMARGADAATDAQLSETENAEIRRLLLKLTDGMAEPLDPV